MGSPRRTALSGFALAATAWSCDTFDESLLDAGPDPGPNCPLAHPPTRPDGLDGDDGTTYFWAVRDIVLDQRDNRWATIGYDLDGLCSYEPDPMVECRPPSPSAPPETDGERGIDNALGHQGLPLILIVLPDIESTGRRFQLGGGGVPLIQVRGWNGEDNDPHVEAVFAQSAFATSVRPKRIDSWRYRTDTPLEINGEPWPGPLWDGNDWWYARAEGFLAGDPNQPRARDTNAYIANRMLVMRLLDRFPILFGGTVGTLQFLLTDTVVTAQISADGMTIEGSTLAGRFAALDILETIPSAGVCRGSEDYRAIERLVDLGSDVRSVPGSGGPGATCDAASVGLYHERGFRANFGGVVSGFAFTHPCNALPDGGIPDAGLPDAGAVDAGPRDAGSDT